MREGPPRPRLWLIGSGCDWLPLATASAVAVAAADSAMAVASAAARASASRSERIFRVFQVGIIEVEIIVRGPRNFAQDGEANFIRQPIAFWRGDVLDDDVIAAGRKDDARHRHA